MVRDIIVCGLKMRRMVAHGHVEVADLQGW
jgi:hypothetical protein